MGLGDMEVHSYLNQPFEAEIALIDINNVPLSGIKTSLASLEDFERIGLERAYSLNSLTFSVTENKKGKPIIRVRSDDRISDPYMQILVDLAWANGQVYRAYTVLLDPPDYQFALDKTNIMQSANKKRARGTDDGVIEKPIYKHVEHLTEDDEPVVKTKASQVTYGPVLENETIWQIAQRYKSRDVSLSQLVIAIVGNNPEQFQKGNLNGLDVGARLKIPEMEAVSQISKALAKDEIQAHDLAWDKNKPIEHALQPPYFGAPQEDEREIFISQLPVPPEKSSTSIEAIRILSQVPSFTSTEQENALKPHTKLTHGRLEVELAAQAVESAREVNSLLKEQIRVLQSENKTLSEQMKYRNEEFNQLQAQMQILLSRQGVAAQVSSPLEGENDESVWPWLLMIIVLGGGGCFAYWWFIARLMTLRETKTAKKKTNEARDAAPRVKNIDKMVGPRKGGTPNESAPVLKSVLATKPVKKKTKKASLETKAERSEKPDGSLIEKPMKTTTAPKDIKPKDTKPKDTNSKDTKPKDTKPKDIEPKDIEPKDIEPKEDNSIDFKVETISKPVQSSKNILGNDTSESKKSGPSKVDENTLDFDVSELRSEEGAENQEKHLDTILELAETYIDMGDFKAAQQSLEEVIEKGSAKQKKKAELLLNKLNKK